MGVSKNEFLKLFGLTLLPFLFYFGRPDIFGSDGYAFLGKICFQTALPNQPIISDLIVSILPCDILTLKVLLFLLCFSAVLALAYLGKLYWENGWLCGLVAFVSPLIFYEFIKFENDQFAFPLIFWAIYFFFRSYALEDQEDRLRSKLYCLGLLIVAGLIWEGTALVIFAFGLADLLFTFVSIPVLFVGFNKLPQIFGLHMGKVAENLPFVSLIWLGFLLLGLNGFYFGNKARWKLIIPATFLLLVSISNAKYVLLVVPFLCLGIMNTWNELVPDYMKTMFVMLAITLPFLYGFNSLTMPPTEQQWQAVDYAISASETGMVQNDWDYGWWVKWHGGITDNFAGANAQWKEEKGIILTANVINEPPDCPLLKDFNVVKVYDCH